MTIALSQCRICHSSGPHTDTGLRTCEDIRELGEYGVFRCQACGNAFTAPDVPPAHYALSPDVPNDQLPAGTGAILRWFVDLRVRKLESLAGSAPLSILDIGAGACAFANAAAARGHRVTAIEPNERNRRFAHGSVAFHAEMFSDALLRNGLLRPGSFDAVTMWHSLEHTPDPETVLSAVQQLLCPGGMLLVSVPNIDSLLARFGGNRWTYLDVPHHLCHFSPSGMRGLASRVGLKPVREYRFSIEYDPFGWYQTLLNRLTQSHNYYYNSRKKRRHEGLALRHPAWTRIATALGPLLLPVAAAACTLTALVDSPACVEMAARKEGS